MTTIVKASAGKRKVIAIAAGCKLSPAIIEQGHALEVQETLTNVSNQVMGESKEKRQRDISTSEAAGALDVQEGKNKGKTTTMAQTRGREMKEEIRSRAIIIVNSG